MGPEMYILHASINLKQGLGFILGFISLGALCFGCMEYQKSLQKEFYMRKP